MKFKLLNSNKINIDYESLYHDSQQKLSWYIEAIETKQIQCDRIESIAEELRKENAKLKKELAALNQGILDLPKLLGKNLGK
jgi:peptidoglycan hydrolase CwlO-like protein